MNDTSDKNDDQLFAEEMGGVRRIKTDDKIEWQRPSKPTTAQLARRKAAVHQITTDENFLSTDHIEFVDPLEILSFQRPGIQHGVFRKLKQGKYQLESGLDLHKKSVEQARAEVFGFIQQCYKHGLRCVQITHGKGLRSKTQPALLKSYVNHWLRQIPEVLAFHSAVKKDGGTGSVYLVIKKNEEDKQLNRERFNRK